MPNKNSEDIKINSEESSLAEFTKRKLPDEKEMEAFDKAVEEEYEKSEDEYEHFDTDIKTEQDERVEESLNEIYSDGKGKKVDVHSLDKVKRHGIVWQFFNFVLTIGVLATIGYGAYYYFFKHLGSDVTAMDFGIEGKTEVVSGEEFFYTINYRNNSNINYNNANIEVSFPENFVFLESSAKSKDDKNKAWEMGTVAAHSSGELKIKGMLAGPNDKSSIVVANLTYKAEGYSSEFKKESSLTVLIKGIGLNINFDNGQSTLVGDANEILIKFSKQDKNYINNFRVTFEPQDNIQLISSDDYKADNKAKFTTVRPGVFQVDEITGDEQILPIKFKFTDKKEPTQQVKILLEQPMATGTDAFYTFLEKTIDYEVMKNDLNLTLIVNGSKDDQGADFGQTLNYSIVYKNKGETEMKDVVIMAVLESDFLDWTTLKDEKNGREKGNTITWTKAEIPELASVPQNSEGTIDFSVKLMNIGQANIDANKDFQVKGYAQFSVGQATEKTGDAKDEKTDNRSNTIIVKINSDLKLEEQVRYFNEDNISVGSGPLPFQVGQKTSVKVYWVLTNNLHELVDTKVVTTLPSNVTWENKSRTNVGAISYDSNSRTVTWDINRLPISVFRADAEFTIGVTPADGDRDTIMVIKPGSEVTATDSVTGTVLKKSSEAKTTKLDDDDIAQRTNDGMVR